MSAKWAVCSLKLIGLDDLPGMRTEQAFAEAVFKLLHGCLFLSFSTK
jgi:hypothetical protein